MIVFNKLWDTMKAKGISTYVLREEYNVESRTIRRLRANQNVTTDTLNKLCKILDCELCDVAEYISE
ncbi:helix-turn-helix transcriptional regulator [Clostridium sp. D33t1_170424_F3]|uniref:helix-turn-helix domain-containing protein n=1 Tax=Clostridium sp. D33t1_170424_F3 TaxID=2787099 RepID=UPI0018ABA31A|nr:helix-turn-helix transcriptional regulator [Clostridium sp. D33t1_170424_F3]